MLAMYEVRTNLPESPGINYQDSRNTGHSQLENLDLVSFLVIRGCFVVIILDAEVVTHIVNQALYDPQFTLHIAERIDSCELGNFVACFK